jgi:Flp pilus assembly protein TadD
MCDKKLARAGLSVFCCIVSLCGLAAGANAKDVNSAARTSASDTATLLRVARATRDAGSPAAALELYRRFAPASTDPMLKVEYGDVLLQNGMTDDAIGVYLAVRETSPAVVGAWLGLERCYDRLAQPGKALAYAERAVERSPRDERVEVAYGVALDAAGRHDDAQRAYAKALATEPRSVAARNDLAISLAVTGRFHEAIDLLTPMVESANASPQVRQNLAFVYGLQGDREKSIALASSDLGVEAARSNMRLFDLIRAHVDGDKP